MGKDAMAEKPAETVETVAETVTSPEVKDTSAGATQEYFEEQGEKSKSNRAKGGDDVKVSLTNKTAVRFIKDHGFFKKGHTQEVSDVALAIYEKAKAVEKL